MIRFYCNSCGKSLRADESIVGRSSKCTSCGNVNRIPIESSRKPGEKKRPDEDLLAVLADSDSFSELNDMDFSASDQAERRSAKSHLIATATETNRPPVAQLDPVAPKFQPRFGVKRRTISPTLVASLAGLLIFLGIVYWIFSSPRIRIPASVPKTAFEQTNDAQMFANALFELKKSRRGLEFAEKGLLDRGLPKSHLAGVVGITQKFDSLVNDGYALQEGNSLFDSGKAAAAQKLIQSETKRLGELKTEIEKETERLNSIIYAKQ